MTPLREDGEPQLDSPAVETHPRTSSKKSWGQRFFSQPSWVIFIWLLAWLLATGAIHFSVGLLTDRAREAGWHYAFGRFATSPGAGGVAAVMAAIIAATAVGLQLRHNKKVEAERSWWERFEWVTTRAVPAEDEHTALPYDLSLDILTSLAERTTDDTQGRACGGFVNHLVDLKNVPDTDVAEDDSANTFDDRSSTSQTEQESRPSQQGGKARQKSGGRVVTRNAGTGKFVTQVTGPRWDRVDESLEAYTNATHNSPARSEKAEQELYERQVFREVFERMPAGVVLRDPKAGPAGATSSQQSNKSEKTSKSGGFFFFFTEPGFELSSPAGKKLMIEAIADPNKARARVNEVVKHALTSKAIDQVPRIIVTREPIGPIQAGIPAHLQTVPWRGAKETPRLVNVVKRLLEI